MQIRDRYLQRLQSARQMSERMLADFHTPQQWTQQVTPGANHALWFAGHMAQADNFFISLLEPALWRDLGKYPQLFGTGSQPVADPAAYPPAAEVLEQMRERRAELLAILEELSDDDLSRKTPNGTPAFLSDVAAVFETAIWHEGVHTGQLSMARRALGRGPIMS